jgi:hypothetical protein
LWGGYGITKTPDRERAIFFVSYIHFVAPRNTRYYLNINLDIESTSASLVHPRSSMSPWLHRPNKPRRSDRIKKLDAVSYVETSLYTRAAVSKKAPAMKASIRTTLANKTPAKKDST